MFFKYLYLFFWDSFSKVPFLFIHFIWILGILGTWKIFKSPTSLESLEVLLDRSNKSIWEAMNPNLLKLLEYILLYLVLCRNSDFSTFWTLLNLVMVIGNIITIVAMTSLLLTLGHISSKIVILCKNSHILFHLGLKASTPNPCFLYKVIRLCDELIEGQWRTCIYLSCNQEFSYCSVCSPVISSLYPKVNSYYFNDDFIYLRDYSPPCLHFPQFFGGFPIFWRNFFEDFFMDTFYFPIWI